MGVNFEPVSVLGSAMDRNRIELDQKFTDLINLISVFKKDLTKIAIVAQTDFDVKCGFKSPSVATAGDIAIERRPHAAIATPPISLVTSSYITSDNKQLMKAPVLSNYMMKNIVKIDMASPPVSQVGDHYVVGIVIVISLLKCRCFGSSHKLVEKAVLSQFVDYRNQCVLNPLTRTHLILCPHRPVIVILCAPV